MVQAGDKFRIPALDVCLKIKRKRNPDFTYGRHTEWADAEHTVRKVDDTYVYTNCVNHGKEHNCVLTIQFVKDVLRYKRVPTNMAEYSGFKIH